MTNAIDRPETAEERNLRLTAPDNLPAEENRARLAASHPLGHGTAEDVRATSTPASFIEKSERSIFERLNTFNHETIEEMKAKVAARVPLQLSIEQTVELLALLDVPAVDSAVSGSAPVEGETTPSSVAFTTNARGERDGSIEVRANEAPAGDLARSSGFGSTLVDDAPAKDKNGPLPETFPGRQALAGAGINTFAQARKARDSKDGLTGVTGVDDSTAKAIEEALN